MYGHSARSPPPLQHPRPQHPPSQIPSTSPPPDAWGSRASSSEYQRFASPPVQGSASGSQLHTPHTLHAAHAYARSGPATPDAYIPAGYGGPQGGSQFLGGGSAAQPGVAWMASGADAGPTGPMGGGPSTGAAAAAGGVPPAAANDGAFWGAAPNGMGAFGQAMGMGGMMNDATAQMGMQFGSHALSAGQAYLDKNFTRLLPLAHLKHSFNVSNGYVINKLRLLLWPWRHRPWSRGVVRSETTGVAEGWKPPREDINCPDLYIPVMSLVTYVLLSAVTAGKAGTFDPRILGQTASKAFGLLLLEFVCIKLGCYLLGIGEEGTMVDLLAYEGYKFVGVIVTLLAGLLGVSGWTFWLVFLYVVLANFFFQLRSLRHLILPDPSASPLDHSASSSTMHGTSTPSHSQRARRIQFLFVIAAAQALSMGFLVRV
ncbi:hypothetical protein JCM1840_000613 [Sporobolomyces johnsonii]